MNESTTSLVRVIVASALGAALVISAIAWPIVWYHSSVITQAMISGYEQGTLPGTSGIYWVKKKD